MSLVRVGLRWVSVHVKAFQPCISHDVYIYAYPGTILKSIHCLAQCRYRSNPTLEAPEARQISAKTRLKASGNSQSPCRLNHKQSVRTILRGHVFPEWDSNALAAPHITIKWRA
jgi:hypothetical protein